MGEGNGGIAFEQNGRICEVLVAAAAGTSDPRPATENDLRCALEQNAELFTRLVSGADVGKAPRAGFNLFAAQLAEALRSDPELLDAVARRLLPDAKLLRIHLGAAKHEDI